MVREFCWVTEFFGDRVEPYTVRGQVLELEYQRISLLLFLFSFSFFLFAPIGSAIGINKP